MDYNKCFSLFNSSYIDKEIKRNVLLNNITNKEDREIIEKFVENVYIKYCIKADKINKEAEKNFSEIEIIEININNYRTVYDIYGILLSIIPYPILAIFRYNDRISFAVSNRIPAEDKNNKGKIYTSYLIKQEDISSYLKIDIDNCQTMIEIYNKWISNVENVVAYYERLDRVMETIEIGFHIKSEEVLEKLESYIVRDCGTYNMKPKEGWKSKLEKYEDNSSFIKKVETHMLWEYLSENTFLKNKLEDFLNWNDFKEACAYNNNMNDIYYSQYNSRMSDNDEIDDIYENRRNNNRYKSHSANIKVETIKSESERIEKSNNIDNTIQEIVEEVKEKGDITCSDLAEIISEKFGKFDEKTINKIFEACEEYGIEILQDDESITDTDEYMEEEYDSVEYERAREEVEKDFMLYAIKIDYNVLAYASDKLLNDKDFMLQVIEYDVWCLGYAKFELRNNPDFMLQAIEKNSLSIKYASDELKDNPDFMLQAIEKDCWCIKYASFNLRNNPEFMLRVIEKNSWALGNASFELRNNQNFMLQAIDRDCRCVYYLSNELVNKLLIDQDLMLKINRLYNKCSINNEILTNNKDLMLQVIENGKWCLFCASDELKNDPDFMLQTIEKDFRCLLYAKYKLKNDPDFMLQAIEKDFRCMCYVSVVLLENQDFMLKAIEKVGQSCLYYITEKLENDKEFMLRAIAIDSRCLDYIGNELKNDADFMLQAIKK